MKNPWRITHREQFNSNRRKWRKEHPEEYREQRRRDRKLRPWINHLKNARRRCKDKTHASYPSYGGKGIKCKLSSKDIKEIWIRDKAKDMIRPSIDRIDSKKHYTKNNCRFLELYDNLSRPRIERKLLP